MVEEVKIVQDYLEYSIFLGKPIWINLPFKCDPFLMEYGLEVFPNPDKDYINVWR